MPGTSKERFKSIREASVRTIVASEKAVERVVERQFQAARLVASLAVGLFLVGFLLVAQWRGVESLEEDLESQSDQELAVIVQELATGNDELRREALRLEQRIAEVERSEEGQATVLNEAVRELQALRVLSGLEEATGPGVSVRVSDPQGVILARDLVSVVNELKAAGAEAIAVDGLRVGATSGFVQAADGIRLDGASLDDSILIEAIGEPQTLSQALGMPGGVVASLGSFPGVTVDVREREDVTLAASDVEPIVLGETYDVQ
jgi:uncharacterized protein YlxW (UPF0749 family)